MRRLMWILLVGLMTVSSREVPAAFPLAPAVATDQIDLDASGVLIDGKQQPVSLPTLISVLGLSDKASNQRWEGGVVVSSKTTQPVQYRIAFKSPVTLGSLLLFGGPRELSLLKENAPYPGDPANVNHWIPAKFPRRQSTGRTVTFEQPQTTRAILLTDQTSRGRSYLEGLRLWKDRLHNATPSAFAYAEREYYKPPGNFSSPFTYEANLVTQGSLKPWTSAGKNSDNVITVPPISDVAPTWFMLTWNEPQSLMGLWMDGNLQKFEIDHFVGPENVNPRAGTDAEWQKISSLDRYDNRGTWISFATLKTRGLRLRITKTEDGPVAEIRSLQALTSLGNGPLPAAALATAGPEFDSSLSPKQIELDIPFEGALTVVIDGPDGRRVRNVVGRRQVSAGKQNISWDLQDEAGVYVPAGTYRWKAIAHPPLKLKYEQTIYPNVAQHAPDNAPWQTKHDGPDGWLADHTAPVAGVALGDKFYLGAPTAESGVSLIECDLDGRKLWGHHSFAAWTGPRWLAAAGNTLFVGARMDNNTTDVVWTVDTQTHKVQPFLKLVPTALSKRGLVGMAAREGELALSVRGDSSWLTAATSDADVDLENCLPKYAPQRKAVKGLSADRRGDFLRLLRLKGTPPGSATQESLVWLETEKGSSNRQHLLVTFAKGVPLGSVILSAPPIKETIMTISILKANAPYPPNVHDASQWIALPTPQTPQWDCIAAPPGTNTRALRITYVRGNSASDATDPLASILDQSKKNDVPGDPLDPTTKKKPAVGLDGFAAGEWQGKLEGVKLLRRRFENKLPQATIRVNSGTVKGTQWDAERTVPLTAENPGIYVMQWQEPQNLHGLAIREIDGKLTKVDVYEGNSTGEIDISVDAEGWREVASYEQARRYWYQPDANRNADARYMDGYVDLGNDIKTRAVRLRIVEQWGDNGPGRPYGGREDLSGMRIEPARCRVFGVIPLSYLGGEVPVEGGLSERLEIYAAADGKLRKELPLKNPGAIAFDHLGNLFAVSGTSIVQVDQTTGITKPLATDLIKPTDITFDAEGMLYVFDSANERKNVRVYNRQGELIRTLGTPGGFQVGAWDPTRMGSVTAIDIDSRGQLWAVESQFYPKRVTVWTKDGKFLREHLGNTEYGGGGVLDPADKSRVIVGPLEFALDWEHGTSKLKNLTWLGKTEAGEVPLRVQGRTYFVTRPRFADMPCGIVYLYEAGKLKMVAAAGRAAAFAPLKEPAVIAKIGNLALPEHRFYWSDLNDDGNVQAEEVTITKDADKKPAPVTNFEADLSLQALSIRFQVTGFTPGGAPIYREESFPGLKGQAVYRLTNGNYHRLGNSAKFPEAQLTPTGQALWTHRVEGSGVQSLFGCGPWHSDQVVAQFGVVGHIKMDGGPLGEFIVMHGNSGGWNIWTADGLLIGPIFHDQRDGVARPWSMKSHERGEILENLMPGQEHFHGWACRSEDGKFRVVAGHNHVSILEVQGLEQAVRLQGTLEVTTDDLQRTQQWTAAREQEDVYVRSPVVDCYRVSTPPTIDGDLRDWRNGPNATLGGERPPYAQFYIAYDEQFLYLGYATRGFGPLKNTGSSEFQRLFKTGASVDLQLGTNSQADVKRTEPAIGDIRILMTYVGNEPQVVLYRPTVTDQVATDAYQIVSPVGQVSFDRIDRITTAKVARGQSSDGYEIEAAIPLASLGFKPADGMRLKMDWGMLVSGPDGNEVLRRVYWANKATNIVADAPSEAHLHPNLWGHLLVHDRKKTADDRLEAIDKPPQPKGLDDLLDGQKKGTGK